MVAGFTRYVSRAAHAGDEVALGIIRQAGELMAKKMIGCYTINHADPKQFPMYACGGAWKAHPEMLRVCNAYLAEHMPGAEVRYGIFAAIVSQRNRTDFWPTERMPATTRTSSAINISII